jgi:hypothetical protein
MNSKLALRNGLFWATALALGTAFAVGDKNPDQGSGTQVAQAGGGSGASAGGSASGPGNSTSGSTSLGGTKPSTSTDGGTSGATSGMSPKSGTMSGGTSGATGGSTSGMSSGSYKNADEAWKAMNTSGQPYLTKQDLASHPEIDFNAADTNHDGKITKSEFEKAWNSANKGGAKKSSSAATGTTSGFTGGSTGSSSSSSMSSPSSSSGSMSNPAYKDKSK